MNLRHINRGDVKEGGCALCKPRQHRNFHHYGGKPDYGYELADGEEAGSEERQPQRDEVDPSGLDPEHRQHEADDAHH